MAAEGRGSLTSTSMRQSETGTSAAASSREAEARASLLLMTPRKWRLVCFFEALVRFLKPLVPPLPPVDDATAPPVSILVVEYWNLGDLAILVPFLRNQLSAGANFPPCSNWPRVLSRGPRNCG